MSIMLISDENAKMGVALFHKITSKFKFERFSLVLLLL